MEIFGEECGSHKDPSDFYCPKCACFRCSKCNDEHQVLGAEFYKDYCHSYVNQVNLPSIKELQLIKEDCLSNVQASKTTLDEIAAFVTTYVGNCITLKESHLANEATIMQMSGNDKQSIKTINQSVEQGAKEKQANQYLPFFQELNYMLKSINEQIKNSKNALAKNTPQLPKPLGIAENKGSPNYIVKEGGSWNKFPIARSVHYWTGQKMHLVNLKNHSINDITLEPKTEEMDSISIGERIFIMGKFGTLSDVYEADLIKQKLIPKAPMLHKKDQHTLCELNNFIYSIGGLESDPLTDCEKYNVKDDKWEQLPNLNMGRACCAAFIFNSEYIYAFAGFSEFVTLEKLPINLSNGWKYVTVKSPCSRRHDIYGIQISGNEAIVFGSRYCNEDESYILKIGEDSAECEFAGNTMKPGMFALCSPPICDGKQVIAVDNERRIHLYNIETKQWGLW